jgi:hypothetical protein
MAIEEKSWSPLGKKHNWRDSHFGYSFKLTIMDETNTIIDKFLWNNSKIFKQILELLRLKYGLDYK